MTISEYAKKEEQCKIDTIGKIIGYGQCWDLVQDYVVNYLGVPEYVLAGCGYVNNLLIPPKINDVLEFFEEVPMTNMLKGDFVVWEIGHIAIFDNWDGQDCWYLTQNKGTGEQPIGGVYLDKLYLGNAHAFRLKGITPDPEPQPEPTPEPTPEPQPEPINPDYLLDLVRRTIRGDYGNGQERIDALGDLYNEVQYQVDQNMAFGLTNWDDIRLF